MNPQEEYYENLDQAQKFIYPNISKSKRKIITQLFATYLDNAENFKYVPVLINNDFSKDHIMFDAISKQIKGIIDFGDIAFGDSDYDFMYLPDEFGEDFLMEILKIYKPENVSKLMKKIYLFSFANKLQIVLSRKEPNDVEALQQDYQLMDHCLNIMEQRR